MPTSFWARVSAVPAAALMLLGCSSSASNTDEIVSTAEEFGSIRLPDDAEVLAARADTGGPDSVYRLSVRTSPDGADRIVEGSNLSVGRPEQADFVIYTRDVLAGPEPVAGPGVQSWQDRTTNAAGDLVTRSITVDTRESPVVYVHLVLADVS
ncbi:hypothetical protein ACQI4F_22650 [Mycolicibacterium vaccae]|uniref:hypothetical protein n=1 Tax=Mycolicibacterium vaccae TaxID=1810 RepID=UPI003CF39DBD